MEEKPKRRGLAELDGILGVVETLTILTTQFLMHTNPIDDHTGYAGVLLTDHIRTRCSDCDVCECPQAFNWAKKVKKAQVPEHVQMEINKLPKLT